MSEGRMGPWTRLLLGIEPGDYRYVEVTEAEMVTIRRYLYGGKSRSPALAGASFSVKQYTAVPQTGELDGVRILLKVTRDK